MVEYIASESDRETASDKTGGNNFMAIAGFLGQTEKGPNIGKPNLITSLEVFREIYGNALNETSECHFLFYAVQQFFNNGGKECYVMRVSDKVNERASVEEFIGVDNGTDQSTGLMAFKAIHNVNIMSIPGISDINIQKALVTHCEETGNRFATIDVPCNATSLASLLAYRNHFDTPYAALYAPWLTIMDSVTNKEVQVPPSGSVAGMYARVDMNYGRHKAPANEVLTNVIRVNVDYSTNEIAEANAKGINPIRNIPNKGIYVWGEHTLSNHSNDKHIHVKRSLMYIEENCKANLQWTRNEENKEKLWNGVIDVITKFLSTCFKNGILVGVSHDETFYVHCGRDTMSQDDISNGNLICEIGVALLRPAEFITFRITQKTSDSE